jgi:hypothetical protein
MTHRRAFSYTARPCQKLASPDGRKSQSNQRRSAGKSACGNPPRQILPGINYAASMAAESGPRLVNWKARSLDKMKVSGASSSSSAGGARPAAPGGAAADFRPIMTPSTSAATGVGGAGGVARVSSIEALMALQEVGGPLERRRRAVGRASRIIDALEDLKLDLLAGGLTPAVIESLTRAVRDQRSMTDDPRLEGLLDEIETRAAVELAKLEPARVAT